MTQRFSFRLIKHDPPFPISIPKACLPQRINCTLQMKCETFAPSSVPFKLLPPHHKPYKSFALCPMPLQNTQAHHNNSTFSIPLLIHPHAPISAYALLLCCMTSPKPSRKGCCCFLRRRMRIRRLSQRRSSRGLL